MNPVFWKGKRVLLTGHTGFKGAWLSLWLRELGADVVGLALAPATTPSLFEIAGVAQDIRSIEGDVRDAALVAHVVGECAPDIVIHMAAQALVRHSYVDPVDTYATNVMGTVHLLEAIRHAPSVRVVVNVTSDKCYENREWVWGYREQDPMGGHDPYSNSKGCAELVTSAYRDSFFPPATYEKHGVALASARAGNVIGGGDWARDRLIPDILRAIEQGQPIRIRSPHAIRPWQHVLEPLSGYLRLAERLWGHGPEYTGGWNFGPDSADARQVDHIVARLTELWGDGAGWLLDDVPILHEARHLTLDCSKAQQLLQWRPRWRLETALQRIVAWHRAYVGGQDMRAHTLADIRAYAGTPEGGGD
ncbi:CDP-glucose 4,6-dehydratase [Pandoraea cepalis]|uniref:CDP-glucose 4,6-dehydratase n=1 Tax=Pandoraea cepalis TaxID=2508294 RepID=A0AAW7MPT3_9BURK|nr:CDP-glucose 4,6-dehydratase [Pandoraea cepalis]MDN4574784.1 CDP-glucose 4,6-dehydratase [Pandoraea cepalis]MDN4580287.1 CDP-glucose 4,6-dehydratase [Pandoraea cepalis]